MFQVIKKKCKDNNHSWGILEVTTISTTGNKSAYTIKQCKNCFKVYDEVTLDNSHEKIQKQN